MITNSYLQSKENPLSGRQKLPEVNSSFIDRSQLSHSSLLKKSNISNNSEPLNSISQNLSFKGSFLSTKPPVNVKMITITEALSKFEKELGKSAAEHLKETIDRVVAREAETGIKREGDTLKFSPESAGKKIKDIALYPIVKMPLDMASGFVDLFKKIPGMKDSEIVKKWSKAEAIQKRKDETSLMSEAAAVERFFKEASENKDFKVFKDAHGRLKPSVSNYSTTIERSVTRFVTGIIPAFFLANDAYNLSMYMNNNKDIAKKEKQRRFNQEVARIGITTAMTFGVFSFFSRKTNASQATTTILMSGVVFVSEFLGRMMAGNPVLPLDENSAKKYAKKRQKSYAKDKEKKVDKKPSDAFKGNEAKPKNYNHPPEKGVLTFENILKVVAGLVVFGFAVEKIKKMDSVAKKLHEWNEKYNSHFFTKVTIKRKEFDELTKKLEDNGFKAIAKKYKDTVKDQKGDEIYLGKKILKTKNAIINDILLFPATFVWKSIILLPYKLTKTAVKAVKKSINNSGKTKEEIEKIAKKAKDDAKKTRKEWEIIRDDDDSKEKEL